jgi:hypothetical protein
MATVKKKATKKKPNRTQIVNEQAGKKEAETVKPAKP